MIMMMMMMTTTTMVMMIMTVVITVATTIKMIDKIHIAQFNTNGIFTALTAGQ